MLVERKGNIEIGGEEVIINKEIVGKEFVLRQRDVIGNWIWKIQRRDEQEEKMKWYGKVKLLIGGLEYRKEFLVRNDEERGLIVGVV